MAEIATAGYQDLRDYIQNNWKFIELRNGSGVAVLRIGIGDPRVTWTHNPGDQQMELSIVVKGSDADINEPVTIASSAIFNVATGGTAFSVETFTSFTITAPEDQLTVKHRIQVPQIA